MRCDRPSDCCCQSINEKTSVDEETVRHLREQRHDFMNHIQVIWGYLQLNKPDQAMKYIAGLNSRSNISGSVLKLDNPALALLLYKSINKAHKLGIHIDLETEIDSFDNIDLNISHSVLDHLSDIFDYVIKVTMKAEEKIIFIDLFSENNCTYLVLSNTSYEDSEITNEYIGDSDNPVKQLIGQLYNLGVDVYYKIFCNKVTIKVGFNMKEA